jgi:hypothetical protein
LKRLVLLFESINVEMIYPPIIGITIAIGITTGNITVHNNCKNIFTLPNVCSFIPK